MTETENGMARTPTAPLTEQIKSRERVRSRGEVFTAPREVNAMLDLVKDETENIDSTFLEPACGTGKEAESVLSYFMTKFVRFLVGVKTITQHTPPKVFGIVPLQDFSKPWTDEELYRKYKLTKEEIAFIESMIKPMA